MGWSESDPSAFQSQKRFSSQVREIQSAESIQVLGMEIWEPPPEPDQQHSLSSLDSKAPHQTRD